VRSPAILPAPAAIQIDASAHCQLACPLCPTADGRTRAGLGQGHLKLAEFRALLERNPGIAHVELSNYGEMFLNPQLVELLQCAYESNVTVSAGNGVNLNHARKETLEALVKYRVLTLTCSLDGATPETYAKYRVNGNLERVLENIDTIRAYRRAYGSAFPLLDWQFVVFGHNEGELEAARAMASHRGMGFVPRLSWDANFSPVRDQGLVRSGTGTGAATREEYRQKRGRGYARDICFQLWHQPVLNWDGRVMGCCVNYWQDFGSNAFREGFATSIRHPNLEYARDMLRGRAEPRPEIPCTRCSHFEEIRKFGDWLTDEEIAEAAVPQRVGGIVLDPPEGVRFAQVMVVEGWDAAPVWETHGRLFRFGIDTAVYYGPQSPGRYTAFVRMLRRCGWSRIQTWRLEVASRPLCQQWNLDLTRPPVESTPGGERRRALPAWIR
jgi:MoaA/NifB/PqqE/SkfB family radical SAM enzyme